MSGYSGPFWMMLQQVKELGGFIKKGEHGSPVVYASNFTKEEAGDDGDEVEREIPFLKEYTVFNAQQTEGLPQHFTNWPNRPRTTCSGSSGRGHSLPTPRQANDCHRRFLRRQGD